MGLDDACVLPATGSGTIGIVLTALVLAVCGAALVVLTRRRSSVVAVLVVLGVGLGLAAGPADAASPCPTTTSAGASVAPPAPTTDPAVVPTTALAAPSTSPSAPSTSSTTPTSTSSTTTSTTTTTDPPVPPVAVDGVETGFNGTSIGGSLFDDGDQLGSPPATISRLEALQGPGEFALGVPTVIDDVDGRPCGSITVQPDGSFVFDAELGPHECVIRYTLTNVAGSSSANETLIVFDLP